jgi:hypothetical protein
LGEDLGPVRGVADHAEAVGQAIDQHVVEHAAVVAGHQAVLDLADAEAGDVIRRGAFQQGQGAGALDQEPSHVADVEEPDALADGLVLLQDRGILHGHRPAAELDETAAVAAVPGVERGLQRGRIGHRVGLSAGRAGGVAAAARSRGLSGRF